MTSLCVRSDGARLAVGNVEGSVLVYRLPGFAKVKAVLWWIGRSSIGLFFWFALVRVYDLLFFIPRIAVRL